MTLTRETLLALKPVATPIEVEGLGTVFVKPLSELQRSKRLTAMWDEKSDKAEESKIKYRVNMIIDQVCDEEAKPLFTEGDAKDILALQGSKLDNLVNAIGDYNDSQLSEKNE